MFVFLSYICLVQAIQVDQDKSEGFSGNVWADAAIIIAACIIVFHMCNSCVFSKKDKLELHFNPEMAAKVSEANLTRFKWSITMCQRNPLLQMIGCGLRELWYMKFET